MTITPTGRPAWEHANDHTTYGGDVNKENYQSLGPVNSKTDVDAAEFVRLAADLAALQRTASFATIVYQCNDTAGDDPTILSYHAMAGDPPDGLRVSDGRVTWTWDGSYPDEYSVDGALNIVGVTYGIIGTANATVNVQLQQVGGTGTQRRVEARAFTTAPLPDAVVTLTIWTGQGS
jgi:hypothetical protein